MSKADQFKALTRKKDEEREVNREAIKSGHVEIVTGLSQSAIAEEYLKTPEPESDEHPASASQETQSTSMETPSESDDEDMVQEFMQRRERKLDNMIGVYVEDEVAKALKRLNKKYGRGFQSRVVNEATRKFLKEQGWI